jgi:hypothetical protein
MPSAKKSYPLPVFPQKGQQYPGPMVETLKLIYARLEELSDRVEALEAKDHTEKMIQLASDLGMVYYNGEIMSREKYEQHVILEIYGSIENYERAKAEAWIAEWLGTKGALREIMKLAAERLALELPDESTQGLIQDVLPSPQSDPLLTQVSGSTHPASHGVPSTHGSGHVAQETRSDQ